MSADFKLPDNMVEWFYRPEPGERGFIISWGFSSPGSDLTFAAQPFPLMMRGEHIRLLSHNKVTQIHAVVSEGVGRNQRRVWFKRTTEAEKP